MCLFCLHEVPEDPVRHAVPSRRPFQDFLELPADPEVPGIPCLPSVPCFRHLPLVLGRLEVPTRDVTQNYTNITFTVYDYSTKLRRYRDKNGVLQLLQGHLLHRELLEYRGIPKSIKTNTKYLQTCYFLI